MESDESSRDPQQLNPASSFFGGRTWFVFLLILYAFVELEFLLKLWILMQSNVLPFDYLLNAVAFELCFLVSLIALWQCLWPSQAEKQAAQSWKNLPTQIFVLAAMLLLALMHFSRITELYDKAKLR